MSKNVLLAGLLGGIMLVVSTLVFNGILGMQARIDLQTIPAERDVYESLKEHVVEPGRYICNPALTPEGRFPDNEPVFSVLYGGMGHEAAGTLALVGLIGFFIAPLLGAWLLSQASEVVLASYPRKVLFFGVIGLVIAILGDLPKYGIGNYPLTDTILLASNHIMVWVLVGLVVAWRIHSKNGVT